MNGDSHVYRDLFASERESGRKEREKRESAEWLEKQKEERFFETALEKAMSENRFADCESLCKVFQKDFAYKLKLYVSRLD